ncbi:hypothetical protein [Saccharicrinis fermentans]|uniref:Cbb3-type cytochrome oxidase, subunit 3 n=1 Tax=Saccharicrinis fermentans DSM 9555 = JCM 21142 TaxID=869213 RepID=W7Y2E1_9BACT|nr:hypothetical protein [Saccharicrinis fermentans]GAF01703.1 hypothetical protein JCM21142_317 [Saccharicrinis fermentans DSM 9555 = JCM 21142]
MGFVSEVLKDVDGIQWYYIIGISIFIILFVIIVYRTVRTPKSKLVQYKNAILEDEEDLEDDM